MRNKLRKATPMSASSKQQAKPKAPSFRKSPLALCIASACAIGVVEATPRDPEIVQGTASFIEAGAHLDIHNSNGAIINWQDFSIAQNESVRFIQESAVSSVLNRVVSGIPSEILGSLDSNGRVFLINPNGIVIGEGARIDTAGLVASTLNISNEDFSNQELRFTGDGG